MPRHLANTRTISPQFLYRLLNPTHMDRDQSTYIITQVLLLQPHKVRKLIGNQYALRGYYTLDDPFIFYIHLAIALVGVVVSGWTVFFQLLISTLIPVCIWLGPMERHIAQKEWMYAFDTHLIAYLYPALNTFFDFGLWGLVPQCFAWVYYSYVTYCLLGLCMTKDRAMRTAAAVLLVLIPLTATTTILKK